MKCNCTVYVYAASSTTAGREKARYAVSKSYMKGLVLETIYEGTGPCSSFSAFVPASTCEITGSFSLNVAISVPLKTVIIPSAGEPLLGQE